MARRIRVVCNFSLFYYDVQKLTLVYLVFPYRTMPELSFSGNIALDYDYRHTPKILAHAHLQR